MSKLPIATRNQNEANALAWAKEKLVQYTDKLTAESAHDWSKDLLRGMALRSGNGAAAVVEIARGGYRVAHDVLLEIYTEQRERDITPFKSLEVYALAALRPGFKFPKQDGKSRIDHTFRNGIIVATVYGVHRLFGLKVYRSGRRQESACSIVASALVEGGFNVPMDEGTVAEIYRVLAPTILQSVQFDNVPEDPLRIIGVRLT